MKNILLVFFIIYINTYCVSAGSFLGEYALKNRLDIEAVGKALESKCRTAENPNQFQHALTEFSHCINDLVREFPSPPNLSDYDQDHCSYFDKSQTRICVRNLTKNISPCLAENEIYIQQLILNAFDVLYEEMCGENGISNKQYIFDQVNRTAECMQVSTSLLYHYGSCNTKCLNIFKNLDEGVLNLSKPDVCSDLKSFHKCITQLLETACNEDYSLLTGLVFQPFLGSCNELDARK